MGTTNNSLKTAYIGGKVTGLKDSNKPLFAIAEMELRQMGYGIVYNPHTICCQIPINAKWETYMRVCVSKLTSSDEAYFLPDWWRSKGARMEIKLARQLRIPTFLSRTAKPISNQEYYLKYIVGLLFF